MHRSDHAGIDCKRRVRGPAFRGGFDVYIILDREIGSLVPNWWLGNMYLRTSCIDWSGDDLLRGISYYIVLAPSELSGLSSLTLIQRIDVKKNCMQF